jgi:hypothetical protein
MFWGGRAVLSFRDKFEGSGPAAAAAARERAARLTAARKLTILDKA